MTKHTTVRGTKELFEAFERIYAEHYREFNVPTDMSPSQRYMIVPYGPYWMISDCLADGEYMEHPVYEIETLEDAEMLRGRLIRGDRLHEKARLPADVQHLRAMGYLKGHQKRACLPERKERMNIALKWLDEMHPIAKAAAQVRVAEELRQSLRQDLPRYLRRLQRAAKRNSVAASMVAMFQEDRTKAAAFFLQNVIARDHLRKFWLEEIVDEVAWQERLFKSVYPAEVIDNVMKACQIALTSYPAGARPALPRRCDIGKAIRRHCGCRTMRSSMKAIRISKSKEPGSSAKLPLN